MPDHELKPVEALARALRLVLPFVGNWEEAAAGLHPGMQPGMRGVICMPRAHDGAGAVSPAYVAGTDGSAACIAHIKDGPNFPHLVPAEAARKLAYRAAEGFLDMDELTEALHEASAMQAPLPLDYFLNGPTRAAVVGSTAKIRGLLVRSVVAGEPYAKVGLFGNGEYPVVFIKQAADSIPIRWLSGGLSLGLGGLLLLHWRETGFMPRVTIAIAGRKAES